MITSMLDIVMIDRLTEANQRRLPLFRNRAGGLAHSSPDGSDWSLSDWTNAVAGEAGEACNLAKKIRRGDFGNDPAQTDDARFELAKELADVVCYADITIGRTGRKLGDYLVAMTEVHEMLEESRQRLSVTGWTNVIAAHTGMACLLANGSELVPNLDRSGARFRVESEIARSLTRATLFAHHAALHLGHTLNDILPLKFNEVSRRVGCDVFL